MIIDTSALLAILRDEPEAAACAEAIEVAPYRRISAANFVEAAIVIDGSRDLAASRRFDDLVKEAQLMMEPFTEIQAGIARDAYRDFSRVSAIRSRALLQGVGGCNPWTCSIGYRIFSRHSRPGRGSHVQPHQPSHRTFGAGSGDLLHRRP